MKVRVWVPFRTLVPYVVEVESLNLDDIKEKLLRTDPSNYERDPNFYEILGSNWAEYVDSIDEECVEEL